MRRLSATVIMFLLPLAAAAQAVGDRGAEAQRLLQQQPSQFTEVESGVAVPLWRGSDGRLLALKLDHDPAADAAHANAPLSWHVVDATSVVGAGLQYDLATNLHAHAGVTQQNWVNQPARLVGSEVGASYDLGRYSVGLSVGASSMPNANLALPRVLPGAAPGVDGLAGFDSSTQLNARGRLALGGKSGIDVGASAGSIRLLPGNFLGVSTLDQRVLSFGVDHGPLSGSLVGRTLRPQVGIPGSFSPDKRWSSIDLGVTWRLPWRGELSVGAQNLWSSGTPLNTPAGPEPDQSRTPYVQYHQDL
jgi:hypothetical protein